MAPKRSMAQKEQLLAIRALRQQEGGHGPSNVADDALGAERARLAQLAAEGALDHTRLQLEAEHDHAKGLYQALRVERRKVLRIKSAKEQAEASAAEAQSSLANLEDQFQHLSLRNEYLELTISEVLEEWALSAKMAEETLDECRKKIKALHEKCRHAPEVLRKAMEKQAEGSKFSLIEKGVYTDEARELCRVLVSAGCSQDLVGKVVEDVLATAGISIIGPTMSGRTVARAVLEGGIMADMQIGHEISNTHALTISSDGTTHKNVGYEARHINMLVPDYELDAAKHKSRLVGVDSAPSHSSQTQADGWTSKMEEKLDLYNQSPLAKRSQSTLRLADFFARLQGMNSDHAKDQKKLAALLQEIKQALMHQSLGEERLLEMSIPQIVALLSEANDQKIRKAGGSVKWAALSDEEKLKADAETLSAVLLKLGHEAYSHLPDEEKRKADFFIWVGCAMHKDLNCIKGGNQEMSHWWEKNNVPGPILLANKDNAVLLEQTEDRDDYTPAEQRAHDISSGGGVKLASLAGMLFNNKNDKLGQQDMHQQFFFSCGIKKSRFPDTSNTRYQSHSEAAVELLTSLALYVEFLEWIRDGKDRPTFTNVEKNVYNGLQDVPTQTELVVLALYAEAISHPYMRQVRGPGTEHINMLDLGPLHFKVQEHLEKVINDPSVLLPPTGSYESGTIDGLPWRNPEAMAEISQLASSLPHLNSVLVAFFRGALVTWKRFTAEFHEGGLIDEATAEEKEHAWMPPTNDVNEGALGSLRSHLRKKPNTTIHQYNALAMFKFNNTANFVHHVFIAEDHAYVRQQARIKDTSHLERSRKAKLVAHKDQEIEERREKMTKKMQQKTQEQSRLAGLQCIHDGQRVTTDMTIAELRDQLEIYRGLVDSIPLKSHLKTKAAMIEALKEAIRIYHENEAGV